jgi:hypothetical protein
MNERDLIGVIFVAILLSLIIVIAALCLCCSCHFERGEKSRRSAPSYTEGMELPWCTPRPFDTAHLASHSKQPFNERFKRHVPYKHASAPPCYTPRAHAANARYVPSRRQPREQQSLSQMYDGLAITPEMTRVRQWRWREEGSVDLPA